MTAKESIAIRHCHSLEDFEQCVSVQKAVWNFADADLIPRRFFVVASKIEGQVIGAFDASGKMRGFCLAVPALHGQSVYLHSHMLAVMPESRKSGLGIQLKLEQRRDALARGIRLIEWTFDPLEWKNASLNLNRLGAIVRRYVPNQYGVSSSPLHRGLPTDRLIAEWWLDSPRVQASASQAPPFSSKTLDSTAAMQRIVLPVSLTEEHHHTPPMEGLQLTLRGEFQKAFAAGLAAVGFEMEGGKGSYLLVRQSQAEQGT